MRVGAWFDLAVARALSRTEEANAVNGQFDNSADTGAIAAGIVERYARAFYMRDRDQYEVVGVETPFNVPIARGVRFFGVIDAVLRDKATGLLCVMEHKTTGSDTSVFDSRFETDPQVPGYLWATHRGGGTALLNAVRRTSPRVPATLKNGLVSTAAIDTTQAVYRAATDTQGATMTEAQATLLASLPTTEDRWICRHAWNYSDAEIARWHSDTLADVRLIRHARNGKLTASRNGAACSHPWQPRCDLRDACVMGDSPEVRSLYPIRDVTTEARLARAVAKT
jgi:hypothetical protein